MRLLRLGPRDRDGRERAHRGVRVRPDGRGGVRPDLGKWVRRNPPASVFHCQTFAVRMGGDRAK